MPTVEAREYLERLEAIYTDLDTRYSEVARAWGLTCEGCEDNCCQRVFLHFTLVEQIYLMEGFRRLPEDLKKEIVRRASEYNLAYSKTSRPEENLKLFCPLNFDARCILYRYRPMACRVYGVPGVLKGPKGEIQFPGCWRLNKQKTQAPLLDRTPFYQQLAELERDLRRRLCYFQKYRKTIAQMIADEEAETGLLLRGYDIFEGY